MNEVRIIGGAWRSRRIRFPDAKGLRPTPDRVRETIFNWLQFELPEKNCLDLFAGSGALGFESLSRGANYVLLIEQNRKAADQLKENVQILGVKNGHVWQNNSLQVLKEHAAPVLFDIVFLDPPFALDVLDEVAANLEQKNWLADEALIYFEAPKPLDTINLPDNWKWTRQQHSGQVYYGLVKRIKPV